MSVYDTRPYMYLVLLCGSLCSGLAGYIRRERTESCEAEDSVTEDPPEDQHLHPAPHSDHHHPDHGQGQPQPPDQQHEVPGQDGEMASLQVYRGVSVVVVVGGGRQRHHKGVID